jgi:hypothetical protein
LEGPHSLFVQIVTRFVTLMGGRALLVSGTRVLDQKIGRGFTHKTTATMVNRPPASFIYGRPLFRADTAPRRNLPRRRTQQIRLVAVRRSWAARGLSSGRFAVVAPCFYTV